MSLESRVLCLESRVYESASHLLFYSPLYQPNRSLFCTRRVQALAAEQQRSATAEAELQTLKTSSASMISRLEAEVAELRAAAAELRAAASEAGPSAAAAQAAAASTDVQPLYTVPPEPVEPVEPAGAGNPPILTNPHGLPGGLWRGHAPIVRSVLRS